MIVELDSDPNNSIRLVTENTDFPSLNLKHIDTAPLFHKIIQLSKEVEHQREVKNCRCDEENNLLASDLKFSEMNCWLWQKGQKNQQNRCQKCYQIYVQRSIKLI